MVGTETRKNPGVILNRLSPTRQVSLPPKSLLCSQSSRLIPSLLQIPLAMASKVISLDELREHTTKEDIWVLLHGKGQFPP